MRRGLALTALLLPLAGCVVPPQPVGYGYGAYPAPGYAADYAYPGYAYNSGSPTYFEGGVTWPLIFYGGSWGYWDGYHRWHRAPEGIGRHLEGRHPGGVGYRPWGGGQFGRPEGPRFGGPGGFGERFEGPRSEGPRFDGRRFEGPRNEGPRYGVGPGGYPGARPEGGFGGPGGFHPGAPPPAFRPGGPPAAAFHPGGPVGGPPGGQSFRPAAAPPSRPAPPPERHRQDDHR